jgi:ADP-heptose:LPS heptosyltransferase
VAMSPPGTDPPRSIVVLRALGLGDLLTAVPALRGLRRAFPAAQITLAAPEALRPLALLIDAVDDVLPTEALGCLASATERPDLAVNLHGRGPESTADLRRLRPHRLLTHFHPRYPHLGGPPWLPDCHEVDRWCQMLAWFDIACEPEDLRVSTPAPSQHVGAVVIHPGASAMSRRWPVHRYARLAAELGNQGHDVVITGGERERALADFVVTRAHLPESANLAGSLSVSELVALISDARLLVCGDTGVAHIATATGTPSILLFGPTPPAHWGPRTQGPHHVLWSGRSGDPHAAQPDAGLLEISTAAVLAASRTALQSCA